MIELPEALVIAQQMNLEIAGKVIESGSRGNTIHKFAFSSGTSEEYAAILKGKTIGKAWGYGSSIFVPIEPGYLLVLGGGGERVLYHPEGCALPKKTHLLLHLSEGSCLTVTVQGWGNTMLLPEASAGEHYHVQFHRIPPLSPGFTWEFFQSLCGEADPPGTVSVKYFLISKPGVWGIGNGCLQDILYHAQIHPKRRIVDISADERRNLYDAIIATLTQMIEKGGRSSESDLYGNRGGYVRILDSKTQGMPCPVCETTIEKSQYLGGAIYYCPTCQQ